SADSDEIFHVVVPRRDIGVTDRPINRDSLAKIGLKIQVAPSVNLAAPHYGAPTHLSAPYPPERLSRLGRVGMLFVAHEKLRRPLSAGVAGTLNRLIFPLPMAIPHSPKFNLPRRNMLDIVFLGNNRTPSLEHERFQPVLG